MCGNPYRTSRESAEMKVFAQGLSGGTAPVHTLSDLMPVVPPSGKAKPLRQSIPGVCMWMTNHITGSLKGILNRVGR